MDIRFVVKRQILTGYAPELVSGTVGYIRAAFSFSREWAGLEKWAHLTDESGQVRDVHLVGDRTEPLDLTAGRWKIWVHGQDVAEGEPSFRITSSAFSFLVAQSGVPDGVAETN